MAKERIGLLGGSFNPIHSRHMDIARCALREATLSRVLLIPTGNPPHKHQGLAPANHRLEMARLSALEQPGFSASSIEVTRRGIIYTVDTLRHLHKQFPSGEFFYIIGEDTLLDLPNWRSPDEVFSLCRFLVCRRSTQDASQHPIRIALEARGAQFTFLSLPPVDVSATAIRAQLAQGLAPDTLSPQVMEYIQLMGLYGVSPSPPGGAALYPRLQKGLSDKRLLHSLLVAHTARALAQAHGIPPEDAALAGLLHDCAKCLPLATLQRIARKHRLLLDKQTLQSANLLHGPVGAVLAQTEYGVTNPNVLSAIRCHTTGKVGMLPLDMALYLADKIEPSRHSYPALEEVRRLAPHSLPQAMAYSLHSTLDYVTAKDVPPHPATRQAAEWIARLAAQENTKERT